MDGSVDWQDSVEKLKWPVVALVAAFFIHINKPILAVILPLLLFHHHTTKAKQQETLGDAGEACEDDAPGAGFEDEDPYGGPAGQGDSGDEGYVSRDPYDPGFWEGGAARPAAPAVPGGLAQQAQARGGDRTAGTGGLDGLDIGGDDGMESDLLGGLLGAGGGDGFGGGSRGSGLGGGRGSAGRGRGGGGLGGDLGGFGDDDFDMLGGLGGFGGFGGLGGEDGDDMPLFGGGGKGKFGGRGKGKKDGKDAKGGKDGKDSMPRAPDPKQVFVGSIGDMSDEDVRSIFAQCGEIVRLKLLLEPDGTPKGSCFVTFETEEQAQQALQLHRMDVEGRRIIVKPANGGKDAGKGSGGKEPKGFGGKEPKGFGGKEPRGADAGGGRPPRDRGGAEERPQRPPPRGPRMEIDDLLEEALAEEEGPLVPEDFDMASKRFLTALMNADRENGTRRSVDALEMVFSQCSSKQREDVRKWPAYIFMLLQRFDPSVVDELAAKRLEERDAERRASGKAPGSKEKKGPAVAPSLGDVQQAWRDCPDQPADGAGRQVLDRWGKPVLI